MIIEDIRKRGFIRAGFRPGHGFPERDPETGRWRGLDIEPARAMAAAASGATQAIEYVPLASIDRLAASNARQIDVDPHEHHFRETPGLDNAFVKPVRSGRSVIMERSSRTRRANTRTSKRRVEKASHGHTAVCSGVPISSDPPFQEKFP